MPRGRCLIGALHGTFQAMPRGRHRQSQPLHRSLAPASIAAAALICAGGAWLFGEAGFSDTDTVLLRFCVLAAAAAAVTGAVMLRAWDRAAGRRVGELKQQQTSADWRAEERYAELESEVEEIREAREKLQGRLREKRSELAELRSEHADLLRRYAHAETERASALEVRRRLEIESGEPAKALTSSATDHRSPAGAPTPLTYLQANEALKHLDRNLRRKLEREEQARQEELEQQEQERREQEQRELAREEERQRERANRKPKPAPDEPGTDQEGGAFDFFGTGASKPKRRAKKTAPTPPPVREPRQTRDAGGPAKPGEPTQPGEPANPDEPARAAARPEGGVDIAGGSGDAGGSGSTGGTGAEGVDGADGAGVTGVGAAKTTAKPDERRKKPGRATRRSASGAGGAPTPQGKPAQEAGVVPAPAGPSHGETDESKAGDGTEPAGGKAAAATGAWPGKPVAGAPVFLDDAATTVETSSAKTDDGPEPDEGARAEREQREQEQGHEEEKPQPAGGAGDSGVTSGTGRSAADSAEDASGKPAAASAAEPAQETPESRSAASGASSDEGPDAASDAGKPSGRAKDAAESGKAGSVGKANGTAAGATRSGTGESKARHRASGGSASKSGSKQARVRNAG